MKDDIEIQYASDFAHLNEQAAKHRQTTEAENLKREAERHHYRAERAEARRIAYKTRTIRTVAIFAAVSVAVTLATAAEMMHPAISVPVFLFCLCAACLRLGAWFGKYVN